MAHWFDTLSKNAARLDGVERRSFLAFGTVLGFGVLNGGAQAEESSPRAGVPAANGASRQAVGAARAGTHVSANLPAGAAGGHVRRTAGALVIHEVSAEKSGLSLHMALAFNRTTQNATISATISRGPELVAKIDVAMTKDRAGTAVINYGGAVSGVRNITVSTKNGATFHGTMDGRAFTAAGKSTPRSQVHFLDGAAPPQIVVDPKLAAAISDLGAQANALLRSPSRTVVARPAARGGRMEGPQIAGRKGPKFHRPIPSGPGWEWYEPSNDEVDCSNCEDSCGNDASAIFSYILAFLTLGTSEIWTYAGCMALCNLPGGGCLPNPCGFFTTCAKADTCFSAGGGRLCCPAPSAVCNNVCCGREITSCGSDGLCGCPNGTQACGSDCFDPTTQQCTDGIICDIGAVPCNGGCCPKHQVCRNGACCSIGPWVQGPQP